jgi:beta-galactosidase
VVVHDDVDLVVVPGLFLVDDSTPAAVAAAAERGATVLVTWFSGIVDETNSVRTGGHPGAFRDLLGVRGDDFWPLGETEVVELDTGWRARRWTEHVTPTTAEVVASYTTGGVAGGAAVTRRPVGSGSAWYLASDFEAEGLGELVDRLLDEAGISPATSPPPG